MMAAITAGPGILVGIGLSWLFNVTTPAISGLVIDFKLYPSIIIGTLVLLVTMTLLASFLPARKAARLPIIEALHYQ